MYYVYVLYSNQVDKFYIGFTDDLRRRIKEHAYKSVHTTKWMKEPLLMYYEACISKKDTMLREKQLKTGFGRGYLRKRLQNSLLGR